jgi:hypothetical protein
VYLDHGPRVRLPRPGWTRRALLSNYLGEARAIANRGGGNLWVVEPRLAPRRLPGLAAVVARYLADRGVRTGAVNVITGSTTARIAILPPPARRGG